MSRWPKLDLNIEMGDGKCFCCGQNNPIGLKLKFDWDGTTARADFNPNENLQGWSIWNWKYSSSSPLRLRISA